jgi:UDP-N-acetylglucosamine:LPS N-acetylglucosamine transferase
MIAAEGFEVEKMASIDFPDQGGHVDFFDLYLDVMAAEFWQLLDLRRLIRSHQPSLIVLDEIFFLSDYCRFRRIPVVFVCDFLGVPRVPYRQHVVRAALERFYDWFLSSWLPRRVDRWVFVGDAAVASRPEWIERAKRNGILLTEPVTKLQYSPPPNRLEARHRLGLAEEDQVVTAAVGCSGTGLYLMEALVAALPSLRARLPRLRLQLLCGHGIDPNAVRPGVDETVATVRGYVRNPETYLAASDAVAIQSGLTTTMECAMLGLPMLVVSLNGHWEQQSTACYAREQYGARWFQADELTPEGVTEALAELLVRPRQRSPYQGDGHLRVAAAIAELLVQ